MAVALNNAGTADRQAGGSFSGSFSVTNAGSNRVAFAIVAWDGTDPGVPAASATYGGNTMTSCGTAAYVGTTQGLYVQVFYLINPPTGANTLAITVTASPVEIYANLISFTGVDQVTPVRAGTYQNTISAGSGGATTFSMTITSNASDLTLSAIADDTGITGTNQTQDGSNTTGVDEMYHDHGTTPAASVTHTWTFASSAVSLSMVGFSIQAATGGVTPSVASFQPPTNQPIIAPLEVVNY